MKYIKLFEKKDPKIGDYVICQNLEDPDKDLDIFFSSAIGKVIEYQHTPLQIRYIVEFENVPEHIEDAYDQPMWFGREEILYISKDKEKLEYIIQANKYNL